jgi:Escherichia/Staphylococcus phage prohead protease
MASTDSARDAAARVIAAAAKGTPPRELRATFAADHAGYLPGGSLRTRPFPGKIRMQMVQQDGRWLYEMDGYATVFNRDYEMWDMFGSYTETVDSTALDHSLAANPDVAFLVNHRGLTMARTVSKTGNPTLFLEKDSTGLHCRAFINSERQDVKDLASAIGDGLVDEMSFAFMLNAGKWNDDYSAFNITEADINRGDVSAVNYGANPYTSIEARASDWLADTERMPKTVVREMAGRIARRDEALYLEAAGTLSANSRELYMRQAEAMANTAEEPAPVTPDSKEHRGKSVKLWQVRLGG